MTDTADASSDNPTPKPRWAMDATWTGDWELPPRLGRSLDSSERAALVALSCGGIGPAGLAGRLSSGSGISEALAGRPGAPDPARAMAALEHAGARAVVPSDAEYPHPVRAISAPPPLLYVRGAPLDRLEPMVAIVGSRACTRGAARFARQLAGTLARGGFTVVSGLARGIDAAAHEGALDGGTTVAVLGTGIDEIYPREHKRLAARVSEAGALVTEFPPGLGPRPWHFPARNRIIAGLSLAVIVVEAGLGSGALITAGFGLEQGREVYACITGPDNPAGAGVREMLRDGARIVIDPEDTLAELTEHAATQGYLLRGIAARRREDPGAGLEGDDARVYAAVLDGSTADEVAAHTGLGAPRVAVVLAGLELEGLITDEGTGRWRRCGP